MWSSHIKIPLWLTFYVKHKKLLVHCIEKAAKQSLLMYNIPFSLSFLCMMSNRIDLKISFAYPSTSLASGHSEEMELFFQVKLMGCFVKP